MRYRAILGTLALAVLIDGHSGTAKAGAWCQFDDSMVIVNCSYVSLQQCLDTVRGVGGGCEINPQPEPLPSPKRVHHKR